MVWSFWLVHVQGFWTFLGACKWTKSGVEGGEISFFKRCINIKIVLKFNTCVLSMTVRLKLIEQEVSLHFQPWNQIQLQCPHWIHLLTQPNAKWARARSSGALAPDCRTDTPCPLGRLCSERGQTHCAAASAQSGN
jgi:hypothetical protein